MAREKPYYSEVLADLQKKTTKIVLNTYDIQKVLRMGYPKAVQFMGKDKTITIYQLASRMLD